MGRLVIMRHGQTSSNVIHALDTALPGAALTPTGQHQAAAAGRALADRGFVDLVVCSSQALRARQTAQGVAVALASAGCRVRTLTSAGEVVEATAEDLGVLVGVHELQAGTLEMRNDPEDLDAYHDVFDAWVRGVEVDNFAGQSRREVAGQVLAGLEPALAVAHTHDVVVVLHGAVMRFAVSLLTSVDPEYAISHPLKNTETIELVEGDQGWEVVSWAGVEVG